MRDIKSNPLILLLLITLLLTICHSILFSAVNNFNSKQSQPQSQIKKNKATSENLIIVDMGSTGTRMHAYNIKKSARWSTNNLPYITEIGVSKSDDNKAVAHFYNNPEKLKQHILPLYNNLKEQLNNLDIDINQTALYYYATAGMRLNSKKSQSAIHTQILTTIINQGHNNKLIEAKTIPGDLEGIFDWLSVNYKLQTLQNKQKTAAALDMGGASTQVAIEIKNQKTNKKNNSYKIKFSDKEYIVYSKSILGYGLDQTKDNIILYNKNNQNLNNKKLTSQYCSLDNKNNLFNYKYCSNILKSYLENKKDHLEVAKVINKAIKSNMKILAYSGFYHNFKFFHSNLPADLLKQIPNTCEQDRDKFKLKFPNLTEDEINQACFNSTYLQTLLHNGYNIPDNYHNFKIPKKDIDWTIGAALYITTNQDSI